MRSIFIWLVLCVSELAHGQVMLVSEAEARSSRAAPILTARAVPVPDAPAIEIVSPDLKEAITSPTKVELRFRPVAPATVKPESFRALYGAFRIDITSRLREFAKVTPEGLVLEHATLPTGAHRIFMEVQDSTGRVGAQLLSVTVR